jgi:WD40 repeat protein
LRWAERVTLVRAARSRALTVASPWRRQIDVKNSSNQKRGKKITGLQFLPGEKDAHSQRLLVTSNDSRIRLYDGYALSCKYKGLKNLNGQIRASFGTDGTFIICGSEDSRVYIWCVSPSTACVVQPMGGFLREELEQYTTHTLSI